MRRLQPLRKNGEPSLRHGRHQGFTVLEMPVGRGGADIDKARGLDQSEALRAPFGDEKARCID